MGGAFELESCAVKAVDGAEWVLQNPLEAEIPASGADLRESIQNAKTCFNRNLHKKWSSPFCGVCRSANQPGSWQAYVTKEGRHTHLGYLPTAEEAAQARDKALRACFPSGAVLLWGLNFKSE